MIELPKGREIRNIDDRDAIDKDWIEHGDVYIWAPKPKGDNNNEQ